MISHPPTPPPAELPASQPLRVLIVEDSELDAQLLLRHLRHGGCDPDWRRVETAAELTSALAAADWEVIISDYRLPDFTGLDALKLVQSCGRDIPFILVSGAIGEEQTAAVMKAGASDFLLKDRLARLAPAIIHELEAATVRRQRIQAEAALRESHGQLEARVGERTAELSAANQALESEIMRRQQAEEERKQVLWQLNKVEETERSRISRELHDRLGQDLTALKLSIQWLQKQCPFAADVSTPLSQLTGPEGRDCIVRELHTRWGQNSPAVQHCLQWLEKIPSECPFASGVRDAVTRMEEFTDSLMREIHRLAWELHPAVLDDLGLDAALQQYLAEWSEHGGLKVDFHSHGMADRRLPLEFETALYRVTQEALTNVLRHAQARRVSVLLERRADHVSLIVEDDGVGFAPEAVLQSSGIRNKLGLLGMQERIRLAGGTLELESTPDRGTTVFVRVPLERKLTKEPGAPVLRSPSSVAAVRRVDNTAEGGSVSDPAQLQTGVPSESKNSAEQAMQ